MEQLPTKEQILEKHYNAITEKYPNKNWLQNVNDAPEAVEMTLAAMEEYAAVRAMHLVEGLEKVIHASNAGRTLSQIDSHVASIARKYLSSYTGDQKPSFVDFARSGGIIGNEPGEQPKISTISKSERRELEELRQWKREAMETYGPIHEYAQNHPKSRLGMSMVEFVVERARKYDEKQTAEQPAQQPALVSSDSDALASPPNFDQLVAMIEKLFRDYLADVMKEPAKGIDKAWERYKILNHLYRDGAGEQPLKSEG